MLERIWPEFQCLKGQGRNSSIRMDRAGIPILERIGAEIQF